jgi:enoyl-CoA hydratase/3-hydroxyacyl-CoA dehydrogenase
MPEMKRFENIIVRKEDNVGWIILNRPHRLNAMTIELLNELSTALDEFEADKDVRCIVITGAGDKAFSVGADVTAFSNLTPIVAVEISGRGQEVMSKIERISKPVIAAINGYALGGGLELALACDFRIASEASQLGQPEIKLGIIPGWGGTQRLPRIIGIAKAKELIMLGDRISADEALRIGLVHRVIQVNKFEEEVKAFAKKLADGPPIALKYAKHTLNLSIQTSLEAGLKIEAEAFGAVISSKDVIEGITAFFEKRKPEFKGE